MRSGEGAPSDRGLTARGPKVGLSLMPSDDWWAANEPLFLQDMVDAVEWSVDFGFPPRTTPTWLRGLLDRFEQRGALYAHGVELSPMSAHWTWQHDEWLEALEVACRERRYRHLTEHYGFITASDFIRGTPMPLPPSRAGLDLAARSIEALREKSGRLEVGIENLAFAFSARDVESQAAFIDELLSATDAFLLLDVHNVFCQAENFGFDPVALALSYPLERVREIHVSGGSITAPEADPEGRGFRRDTHDDRAPDAVLALLEAVLDRCPKLEAVILERTDRSLFGRDEAERHREEFLRLRRLMRHRRRRTPVDEAPTQITHAFEMAPDDPTTLDGYQSLLLESLDEHEHPEDAKEALMREPRLEIYRPYIATFEPRALEIAHAMVRQWGERASDESSMRAAVLSSIGSPLQIRSLPRVEPGPGQVRIRVAAVGLCGTDVHACRGRYPVPTPIVLGHETVGVVDAVGEGVESFVIGDRVGTSWIQRACGRCAACLRGFETRCEEPRTWIENGGGLSEWTIAEATGCTILPDSLGFEEAAPLFCAGHVVMSGFKRAAAQPGERVAVVGLGGLGHLALQVAAAFGHEVVAVSDSLEKLEDARTLFGAHQVVVAKGDPGAALDRIGGADVVIATTSDMAAAGAAVSGLRHGGRLVVLGIGDGPLAIDGDELVQREAVVIGAVQGPREDLFEVLALAAEGSVRARTEAFPLMLVQRALNRLADGRVRYRAVVTME